MTAVALKEGDATLLFVDGEQPAAHHELAACEMFVSYFRHAVGKDLGLIVERIISPLDSPFKPVVLVALGALRAYQLGYDIVYYGSSRDDERKGASVSYLSVLRSLADVAQADYDSTGAPVHKVLIEAPLALLTLWKVLKLGEKYKVPWTLTYSCERGDIQHCGQCFHCRRRQEAFLGSGIDDPAPYEHERGGRKWNLNLE